MQIFFTLSLNFPHSDDPSFDVLTRHLSALKTGVAALATRYSNQPPPPNKSISSALPSSRRQYYVFPYPTTFSLLDSDEGEQVEFSYTDVVKENTFVFTGSSVKGPLLIKFVRKYGREAHSFCAQRGFAPKIFGFESLAGGWLLVAMEHLDDTWVHLTRDEIHREGLKDRVKSAIAQLHEGGLVHGDIRNTNIMVKETGGSEIMLVDFDWAGRIGEVTYPKFLNLDPIIGRPAGVVDCAPILPEHDNHMFKYLFRD